MASLSLNEPPLGNHSTISLATQSDLTLRVIEYDQLFHRSNQEGSDRRIRSTVDFEVKRKVVSDVQFSRVLARMLNFNAGFREARQEIVELRDQTCRAVEPFPREIHGSHDHHMEGVNIKMVWLVLHTAEFFGFDLSPLGAWFDRWYHGKTEKIMERDSKFNLELTRQVLYPAYAFNHARAFNDVTDFLVINGRGHITESTPVYESNLHLPSRIIRMLSPAILSTQPRDAFVPSSTKASSAPANPVFGRFQLAPAKKKFFFEYFKKMYDLKVLPFETHFKGISIEDMAKRALGFDWTPPNDSCRSCQRDYKKLVEESIKKAANYFDGLCLDCMDASKSKTGDRHSDYWQHHELRNWSSKCRVEHGQPTWYFSFMGRKEDQTKMLREIRRDNRDEDWDF
ncbi:MAG: hypothetical protein M1822_004535 [Bathelium mastoideum]|nr:MAG: hypothetical protein M1822_004535 [Bathelium mastoideum]